MQIHIKLWEKRHVWDLYDVLGGEYIKIANFRTISRF